MAKERVKDGADRAQSPLLPNHYRVFVTYAPMPPFDELLKVWGEKRVSYIFDGRPFESCALCINTNEAPNEKTFYVHDACSLWRSEEQIAWGAKQRNTAAPNGYRPATHLETYEFAKAYPELVNFTGHGSFALDGYDRFVTCVLGLGGARTLLAYWGELLWPPSTRILFVSN